MSQLRFVAGLAVVGLWAVAAAHARADAPADPLRLVPAEADVVVKLERPRPLVEDILNMDLAKGLLALDAFRELYDSTNARRAYQLIAYFEKELGAPWPELLDRLAGGGAVLAVKLGGANPPVLAVLQSKDEGLLRKFVKTVRAIVEQELARDDAKGGLQAGKYRNLETLRLGNDLHAAVAGSALVICNKEKGLQLALDNHLDGGDKNLARHPAVAQARKLIPGDAFGWVWINMESVRKQPGVTEGLNPDATDPILTVFAGGLLDQFRRTPFEIGALVPDGKGLKLTIRTPVGREGMNEGLAGFHLPSAEHGGALPLLEPQGVLFSMSYVLDFHEFWEKRTKILNPEQVKALEEFDRNSGKFLGGNRVSWMMKAAGPHQRFVAAHQAKTPYTTKTGQQVPAFAFIVSMREPKDFTQAVETALRTAALVSLTQVKLKSFEEKHGDLTIVGWRFPEDEALEADVNGIRFNFMPCFVAVGNQFVISSTVELARELIDILQKEAKSPPARSQQAMRMRFYAAGAADYLQSVEDQLLAQTILDRALAPTEAREQVKKLIDLVRRAGAVEIEQVYGARAFRYDIKYAPAKR